jgi:hypothetical protein
MTWARRVASNAAAGVCGRIEACHTANVLNAPKMTTDKIYIDASQPAILRHLGGTFAWATLGEAMIAWDQLPDKGDATIQVRGQTYTANEIARFDYRADPRH